MPLSNASSATLPPPSHGSGPEWFATPSLYDSFIRYSMPVYPGAIQTKPSAPPLQTRDLFWWRRRFRLRIAIFLQVLRERFYRRRGTREWGGRPPLVTVLGAGES